MLQAKIRCKCAYVLSSPPNKPQTSCSSSSEHGKSELELAEEAGGPEHVRPKLTVGLTLHERTTEEVLSLNMHVAYSMSTHTHTHTNTEPRRSHCQTNAINPTLTTGGSVPRTATRCSIRAKTRTQRI